MSTLQSRFESKYEPCPATGCFIWTGSVDDKGYGRIFVGNNDNGHPKGEQAHRVAYRLFIGPIPEGTEVCHSCDVPGCVNPAHLFAGTHKENMQDRDRKGRAIAGQSNKTHCPKGHPYDADNTYMHGSSRKCRRCMSLRVAKHTGVTPKTDYVARPHQRKGSTHCKRGHELSGDNLIMKGAKRACRECTNARQREKYQAKKEMEITNGKH